MKSFPAPLDPPSSFYEARQQRYREIIFATGLGFGIRLAIVVFQLTGALYFDSATLLTDAFSTLADLVSTAFLLICIQLARRPPDANHPFGHGRYEPLGGLQLGLLLVLLGATLAIQQGVLFASEQGERAFHAAILLFPLISVALLEVCYQVARRAAKRWDSTALTADAYHYRTDAITSLFAAFALLIAYFWPSAAGFVDRLGAIGIAFLMILIGLLSSRENLHQLVDHVPNGDLFKRIRKAAKNVPGVMETEKLQIQSYGPDAFVAIDVEVDPQMPVDKAHRISQLVRVEIQREWPNVRDVLVHIEPYYPADHDPDLMNI